jgi:hypothetical protein
VDTPTRAIVLSFDRQLDVARLVVESYQRLWPGCPLVFRVPYTDRDPATVFRTGSAEFVHAPPDIRGTMASLLAGIADGEFVFWCIDDRYPIAVLDLPAIEAVHAVARTRPARADAIKLTDAMARATVWPASAPGGVDAVVPPRPRRTREETVAEGPPLVVAGTAFLPQRGPWQHGFYMPQFVRAEVLRRFFLHPDLPPRYGIREFHDFLGRFEIDRAVYFPERFLLSLGESVLGGRLSANCRTHMLRLGLPLPAMDVQERCKTYGP